MPRIRHYTSVDVSIVEELRTNRESGAKRLESEYKAGLMTLARRFCADTGDAEELVNRTFAVVVARIDDYLEQSAFFAWMCQILSHLHSEDIRRKSNKTVVYTEEVPHVPDEEAEDRIFRDVDVSLLREAVEGLPDDYRESIVLHYFTGLSVPQIARFVGIPAGTVKSRLHYARKALAEKLCATVAKAGARTVLVAAALLAVTAVGAAGWGVAAGALEKAAAAGGGRTRSAAIEPQSPDGGRESPADGIGLQSAAGIAPATGEMRFLSIDGASGESPDASTATGETMTTTGKSITGVAASLALAASATALPPGAAAAQEAAFDNVWTYDASAKAISRDGWKLNVTWSAANPGVLSSRSVNGSMIAAHPATGYETLDLRRLAVSYGGELHPITDVRLVTSTLGGSRSVPDKVYFSHVTSVGDYAFNENPNLREMYMEESTPTLGRQAWRYSNGTPRLEKLSVKPGFTNVTANAFLAMTRLDCEVMDFISPHCESFGKNAFGNTPRLHGKLTLRNLKVWPESLFYGSASGQVCGIEDVEIRSGLTAVPANGLRGLWGVTNIVLRMPDLATLGSASLCDLTNLVTITFATREALSDATCNLSRSIRLKSITFGGRHPPNATIVHMIHGSRIDVNQNHPGAKDIILYASKRPEWGWKGASDIKDLTATERALPPPEGTFGVWCYQGSATKRSAWVAHRPSPWDVKGLKILVR